MATYMYANDGTLVMVGDIVNVADERISVNFDGTLASTPRVTARVKLTKINPKNVKFEYESGEPRGHHRAAVLSKSEDQSWDVSTPTLREGTVFRFTDKPRPGGELHVVTKVMADGRVHSAPLGGGDRFRRRGVHASVVEVVDVTTLTGAAR